MATLALSSVSGTVPWSAASAGGDKLAPGDRVYLAVDNRSGASITVTVAAPNACNFGTINAAHNLVKPIAAGETQVVGPLWAATYLQSDGLAWITYSSATTVFVSAVSA